LEENYVYKKDASKIVSVSVSSSRSNKQKSRKITSSSNLRKEQISPLPSLLKDTESIGKDNSSSSSGVATLSTSIHLSSLSRKIPVVIDSSQQQQQQQQQLLQHNFYQLPSSLPRRQAISEEVNRDREASKEYPRDSRDSALSPTETLNASGEYYRSSTDGSDFSDSGEISRGGVGVGSGVGSNDDVQIKSRSQDQPRTPQSQISQTLQTMQTQTPPDLLARSTLLSSVTHEANGRTLQIKHLTLPNTVQIHSTNNKTTQNQNQMQMQMQTQIQTQTQMQTQSQIQPQLHPQSQQQSVLLPHLSLPPALSSPQLISSPHNESDMKKNENGINNSNDGIGSVVAFDDSDSLSPSLISARSLSRVELHHCGFVIRAVCQVLILFIRFVIALIIDWVFSNNIIFSCFSFSFYLPGLFRLCLQITIWVIPITYGNEEKEKVEKELVGMNLENINFFCFENLL